MRRDIQRSEGRRDPGSISLQRLEQLCGLLLIVRRIRLVSDLFPRYGVALVLGRDEPDPQIVLLGRKRQRERAVKEMFDAAHARIGGFLSAHLKWQVPRERYVLLPGFVRNRKKDLLRRHRNDLDELRATALQIANRGPRLFHIGDWILLRCLAPATY